MKTLRIALAWSVLGGWAATAGTLEIKPLGKPVRLHDARIAAAVPSPQIAPFERIWELREGPTIDVATGQIIASGGARGNAVIYNNTTNSTGYFHAAPATTQLGDMIGMTNDGWLQRMQLSVFNGDATNKLLTAKIKVVFYDGATPTPNLLASFTTPTIDFGLIVPGGILPGNGVLLALDVSNVNPLIILPQLVYVGSILKDISGIPAAPAMIGQAIYSPPTIGASKDNFWDYTFDGTGVFTKDEYFGGEPRANFYYELEVNSATHVPPPSYSNTTNSLNAGVAVPAEVLLADDVYTLNTPAGAFLNRLDFSIYNGDTTTALDSLDVDLILRDWNPANSEYYPENDPTHSVTFALTGVAFSPALPPNYASFWYIDGLASLNISTADAILAGTRFRHFSPHTISGVGQALFYPPTVGGTEDTFFMDADLLPGSLYWGMSTGGFCSCLAQGDMNCDGVINNQDIDGFVDALFGLAKEYDAYLHSFPVFHYCFMACGDFTGDCTVNSQDIDGFVAALF